MIQATAKQKKIAKSVIVLAVFLISVHMGMILTARAVCVLRVIRHLPALAHIF
jgi:hypothetical protein